MSPYTHETCTHLLAAHLGRPNSRGEAARIALSLAVHPSLISQIAAGTKSFTTEQAFAFSEYLEYSEDEREYLLLLVQRERAGTKALKTYFTNKLSEQRSKNSEIKNRVKRERELSEKDLLTFYSSQINIICWLATSVKGGASVNGIAQRLQLSKRVVAEAITFLGSIGLCKKLAQDHYQMTSRSVHIDRASKALRVHHTNWRLSALQAFDRMSEQDLMYTAPVSISKKDFGVFKEKLLELIRGFAHDVVDSEAETFACLNIDFFEVAPLTSSTH